VTQNVERVGTPTRRTDLSDERAKLSTARTGTASARRRWQIGLVILAMAAGVVAFLIYQDPPWLSFNPKRSRIPLHFPAHYWLVVGHVLTGNVVMVTLVLQLWPWLRRRHPAVHRWSGRLYVFAGALPSAGFAIAMLPISFPAGRIGVAMSAFLWSVTSVIGWVKLRQGNYAEHRRWMLYSVAIVWGQVMWGFLIGKGWFWWSPWQVNPVHIVEAARWLGWTTNLILVQWWLERTRGRPLELPRSARLVSAQREPRIDDAAA
jgi:hypothetical protein